MARSFLVPPTAPQAGAGFSQAMIEGIASFVQQSQNPRLQLTFPGNGTLFPLKGDELFFENAQPGIRERAVEGYG